MPVERKEKGKVRKRFEAMKLKYLRDFVRFKEKCAKEALAYTLSKDLTIKSNLIAYRGTDNKGVFIDQLYLLSDDTMISVGMEGVKEYKTTEERREYFDKVKEERLKKKEDLSLKRLFVLALEDPDYRFSNNFKICDIEVCFQPAMGELFVDDTKLKCYNLCSYHYYILENKLKDLPR